MKIISTIRQQRQLTKQWQSAGQRVAFVPTMGNLHAGHLSLVKQAQELADVTVVSIFVNPLQFGPNEDFAKYPRTWDSDLEKLAKFPDTMVFSPTTQELYGEGQATNTLVSVPGLSDDLCGLTRHNHFQGVATVVTKLFNIVQADVAIFGEKDFQQLTIIKKMVRDLNIPIEIVGMPTIREEDGLAMSSRNQYLASSERAIAANLYQTLQLIGKKINNTHDFRLLEKEGEKHLASIGFKPDYVAIRRVEDLEPAKIGDEDLIILTAAILGKTRLIDNIRVYS